MAWCHNAGDWGHPNPIARLTLPPGNHTGLMGCHHSFSVGEQAGNSEPPLTFKRSLCKILLDHTPPPQHTHLTLPLCSPHSLQIMSASLLGLTLTLVRPQSGPSQGAWCHNTGDLGQLNINDRLTLPPGPHMGPMGRRCSFSVGERAGPSVHMVTFEGAPRQNPWAHAPLSQHPHFGLPHPSPHRFLLRSAGLMGTNPNTRSAPSGPFQRGLAPQCWDWGLPSPSARITL